MKCKICCASLDNVFSAQILGQYSVNYFFCANCGFLQTEEPYWLEQAYKDSINLSDTGYLIRNISLSKKLALFLRLFFPGKAKFLDYAGGYGVFVRLMRDFGFDFYWLDKYTDNIFARMFVYQGEEVAALTSFESFEHFVNPMFDIAEMLSISKNIIFTTELLPEQIPRPDTWWYYGLEHGQHVSFYSKETLNYIAQNFGVHYSAIDGFHVFSERKIPKLSLLFYKFLRYFCAYRLALMGKKSKVWADHCLAKSLKKL